MKSKPYEPVEIKVLDSSKCQNPSPRRLKQSTFESKTPQAVEIPSPTQFHPSKVKLDRPAGDVASGSCVGRQRATPAARGPDLNPRLPTWPARSILAPFKADTDFTTRATNHRQRGHTTRANQEAADRLGVKNLGGYFSPLPQYFASKRDFVRASVVQKNPDL